MKNNKRKWLILLIISILAVFLIFADLFSLNINKENQLLKHLTISVILLGLMLIVTSYSFRKIKKITRGSI